MSTKILASSFKDNFDLKKAIENTTITLNLSNPEEPVKFSKKNSINDWIGLPKDPFYESYPSEDFLVSPWLRFGDCVLITGYGRKCGFAEKLVANIVQKERFFGAPNTTKEIIKYNNCYNIKYPNEWEHNIVFMNFTELEINKEFLELHLKNLKNQNSTLICYFQNDDLKLRNMQIWDSVIEIRREKKYSDIHKVRQIKFLRNKNSLLVKPNISFWLVECKYPCSTTEYENNRRLYFVDKPNGYEDLKPIILQLFNLGKTAEEIVNILEKEDRIILSLSMLNKLKREWGLRSYRLETKPRKTKQIKSS